MARTTEDQVAEIIEVDSEISLDPFIETASNIVDRVCLESGYSDATLELIERWLSAHCYALRDPRSKHEGVRGILETFEGSWGLGLDHTRYGQMAKIVDTAGNLAALDAESGGAKFKAGFMHIGGPLTDNFGTEVSE